VPDGVESDAVNASGSPNLGHFYDHNSYKSDGTSKLDLEVPSDLGLILDTPASGDNYDKELHEITGRKITDGSVTPYEYAYVLNDLGYLATLATTRYSSHVTKPRKWTLSYINGFFQTNASFSYPTNPGTIVDNSHLQGYNANLDYTSTDTTYSVTVPTSTGDRNINYKWLVITLPKDTSYINLPGKITNINNKIPYFNMIDFIYDIFPTTSSLNNRNVASDDNIAKTVSDKLKLGPWEEGNDGDIIGFIRIQHAENALVKTRICRFAGRFKPQDKWYNMNTDNLTQYTLFSHAGGQKHGSQLETRFWK
jgi:hypothetical protein